MMPPQATSQLDNVLGAGIDQISAMQTITFTKYYKCVLPLDGYVFWINSALVSNSAVPNAPPMNTAQFNQSMVPGTPSTITVQGSFHYDIERRQVDDQTLDVNHVVFTAEQPISDFNEIGPRVMYLGSFNNPLSTEGTIRFAFDRRQNFYQQAGKYHYIGDAVYPDLETQIIDDLSGFDSKNVIVSNSLPIWLAMNQMTPPFPYPVGQAIPMYPSFVVPDDVVPPYGVVHIYPESTQNMTMAPYIDAPTSSHWQLSRDRVKITLLGLRNFNAMDFIDYVNNLSMQDNAPFGIMDCTGIRDEKRNQDELSAIAMKKSVTYEINYYQNRMRDIALQFILSVVPTYIVGA